MSSSLGGGFQKLSSRGEGLPKGINLSEHLNDSKLSSIEIDKSSSQRNGKAVIDPMRESGSLFNSSHQTLDRNNRLHKSNSLD